MPFRGAAPGAGAGFLCGGDGSVCRGRGPGPGSGSRGRGRFQGGAGEYGGGKTFYARWLQERAMGREFAAAEVHVSESDTSLHRLETVFRRLMERLTVSGCRTGALRVIIDSWLCTLDEDILAGADVDEGDERALTARTEALMEQRLAEAARRAPAFEAAPRGYRRAMLANDMESAERLISWLSSILSL